jgi:hypothetical protein
MSDSPVPRRAERLLEALGADTDFREWVIGDLAEEFEIRVQWDGRKAARRWYYRECFRVAPYLLRDWARNLRLKQVGYLGLVVVCATAGTLVLDVAVRLVLNNLLVITKGMTLGDVPTRTVVFPSFMLIWTAVDGLFAGYVAAHVGRRAPLPSAMLVALTWMGLMLLSGWHTVPAWFLALNVTMMAAGTIAGGAMTALRSARAD